MAKEREIPEYNEAVMCPTCGELGNVISGYGLIGGGCGPYTMCDRCGDLLTKSQDEEAKIEPLPIIDTEATEVKHVEDDKK